VLQALVSRDISPANSDAITFGVLIAVLLLRPQGLLGAPDYGRARRSRGAGPPPAAGIVTADGT
jgi:hypothetical protein